MQYKSYYILKCDIHHFFACIDHEILKQKLRKRIKDKDGMEIIDTIIDSYNSEEGENKGIGIGSRTSQIFAIFYLNDLDHYIKEILKIKYYVRYQDDFCLLHPSKEYLKNCLTKITQFLEKEKLQLNKKTRIYTNKENMTFLGRDKKRRYVKYQEAKKKIRIRKKQYFHKEISVYSYCSSKQCLQYLIKGNKKQGISR